ncbi:phosphatidylglycerophosphatase A family protein [Cupriavidus basilensis]
MAVDHLAPGFLIGLWACARTARDMGVDDHGSMVWDEIIAFWLVLGIRHAHRFLGPVRGAFLWFRLFDIAKPAPIAYYDRTLKGLGLRGAFGVMFGTTFSRRFTPCWCSRCGASSLTPSPHSPPDPSAKSTPSRQASFTHVHQPLARPVGHPGRRSPSLKIADAGHRRVLHRRPGGGCHH